MFPRGVSEYQKGVSLDRCPKEIGDRLDIEKVRFPSFIISPKLIFSAFFSYLLSFQIQLNHDKETPDQL